MKHFVAISLASLACLAGAAHALEGRVIAALPERDSPGFEPLSVPYPGPMPSGRIELLDRTTGERFPAQIVAGSLLFVGPALNAGTQRQFEVRQLQDTTAPRVRLDHDPNQGTVTVHIRGEHFTTYHYGDNHRIPFLWPVRAEGAITITRNFPLGTDQPVESHDHRHHVSLWTGFGDVNGADTWHRSPIRTRNVMAKSGDVVGLIRAYLVWYNQDGEPQVDEIREYRFYDGPAGIRFIDQTTTFRAAHGPVTFGDNKEGLVAFRIRPEIQGNRAGALTNAEGKQGERQVYGTPGPWMDYSGPVEGYGNRGIALFSHPSNFRLPAWHVRDYGLLAANPFALSEVARLGRDGSHTLNQEEELTLRYRVFIHSGNATEAGVALRYAHFADPPQAVWAD